MCIRDSRISYEKLGSVGLNLTGVSTVTGGMYASMTYDPDTGYLPVSYTHLDVYKRQMMACPKEG